MTLDYNDSRIKIKTRVEDKDEISSCNCNNCNNKIDNINKSDNRDYNNESGNNNRDDNYNYDKRNSSDKLEFIGVSRGNDIDNGNNSKRNNE